MTNKTRSAELLALEKIGVDIGSRIDYVQGGGGNISVKLDAHKMAIKASGFRIGQVDRENGYVVVNHDNIADYYNGVDSALERSVIEEQSNKVIKDNIDDELSPKNLRPSVEVGFHSILRKYVIHTHSVYSNIIGCSADSADTFVKLFADDDFDFLSMPYIDPGHFLTIDISRRIKAAGCVPKAIFMDNHGVIVNADDLEEALELHEYINNKIIKSLNITEKFPKIDITEIDGGMFKSKTGYVCEYMEKNGIDAELFDKHKLYPDQLVYLNANMSDFSKGGKIAIDAEKKTVDYHTTGGDALNIEETLVGYLYVISEIGKLNRVIRSMGENAVDFINNWESEAYRKNLNT